MGSDVSRSVRAWRARKLRRVVIVGLDNSGKTTAVNKLAGAETQGTVPTTEADYSEAKFRGITLLLTDVGGQQTLRPYWRHHFTGTQGVLYVIDSMDKERFLDARSELRVLLVDSQLKGVPVAFFANKQDAPSAVTAEDILKVVLPDAAKLTEGRPFKTFSGSALSGDGLLEAMEWLSSNMKAM